MSKPLTLLNREDKGDVDPDSRDYFAPKLSARFPSYFLDFYTFARFLVIQPDAVLLKRRLGEKHEIPAAAAIMAIV
jgi:hypothetical protein